MSTAAVKRFFKIIVEYDGTEFHGWQLQPGLRTVQGCLRDALARVSQGDVELVGASRTDRGVHARGQVARGVAVTRVPELKLRAALNGVLPEDVIVRAVEERDESFHPRFQARGKHYRYWVESGGWPSPLRRRWCWHVPDSLNLEAMREEAQALIGEHDFASFAPAREERGTVRCVTELQVSQRAGTGLIAIDVAGDGFLWNQVRTMVGTLVDVGRGRWPQGEVARILAAKNRRAAGPTAPAQGLTLLEVFFDEDAQVRYPGGDDPCAF